jgi:hypothetical protein
MYNKSSSCARYVDKQQQQMLIAVAASCHPCIQVHHTARFADCCPGRPGPDPGPDPCLYPDPDRDLHHLTATYHTCLCCCRAAGPAARTACCCCCHPFQVGQAAGLGICCYLAQLLLLLLLLK